MNFFKKILVTSLSLVLIIFCAPLFGYLYKVILGEKHSGGFFIWTFEHPEYFGGFFIAYAFFSSLFLTIFGGKRKYLYLLILLGIEFLIFYDAGIILLFILVVPAIVAWLIGQTALLIKKKATLKK